MIDKFLLDKGIESLNTRLLKINQNRFCYLVASVEERLEEWEGSNIVGYYGKQNIINKLKVNSQIYYKM